VQALLAGVKAGCVHLFRVEVTLCDPIWQATPHSSGVGFPIKNLLWL